MVSDLSLASITPIFSFSLSPPPQSLLRSRFAFCWHTAPPPLPPPHLIPNWDGVTAVTASQHQRPLWKEPSPSASPSKSLSCPNRRGANGHVLSCSSETACLYQTQHSVFICCDISSLLYVSYKYRSSRFDSFLDFMVENWQK